MTGNCEISGVGAIKCSDRYVTVDVFTDRAFGGNPLAVVLDAGGLSTAQMQAIASELQLFRDHLRAAAARCGQ